MFYTYKTIKHFFKNPVFGKEVFITCSNFISQNFNIMHILKTLQTGPTQLEVDFEHWPLGISLSPKPSGRERDAIQVGESFHNYQGEIWLLLSDRYMEEFVQNPVFFSP